MADISAEQKAKLLALSGALEALQGDARINDQCFAVYFTVKEGDKEKEVKYVIKLRNVTGEDGIDTMEYRPKLQRD